MLGGALHLAAGCQRCDEIQFPLFLPHGCVGGWVAACDFLEESDMVVGLRPSRSVRP